MWQYEIGNDGDVVISTRVRIARNIANIKFPHLMNKNDTKEIKEILNNALKELNQLKYFELKDITKITKMSLVEKHIISPELLKNEEKSAIILNDDTSISIMVNEEDHLRMQSLKSGFDIDSTYNIINDIDDRFGKNIEYAFSEKYGYLTACPTNVGCGLRVSLMLHLPGLVKTGYIARLLEDATNLGIVIRGIYGENSKSLGDIFQVSNQNTLGKSEQNILNDIKHVVEGIIDEERKARELLLKQKEEFEDKVYRAYGILKNARVISSKEAHRLLSDLKVGVDMKLVDGVTSKVINELRVNINPYTLEEVLKCEMDDKTRDIKRAEYIRERLGGK